MKLYQDYKKLFKNTRRCFVLTLAVIIFIFPIAFSRAQTATDIQNKINQNNSNIQNLEQEITAYQTQLDGIEQQKSSLAGSIKELDLTKKQLDAEIAVTQNKINQTNLTIQNLGSNIADKEEAIQNNLNSISLEIKEANELEQESLVENILSQNDLSFIWNDIDNMVTVRESIQADIIKLQQTKSVLEDTQKQMIDAKDQLTKLKSQFSDQQKIVIQNANEKSQLLKQTKNSEANYQKLLKDRIAQRSGFEKEITDYEAQLKFILDPSKLPPAGVLSWPLQKIFVTQLFGKTVDSKRLYVSGTHNGVDFRASVGIPVMSMADGVVLGTGNTDLTCPGASYGNFVFIQYDDGLSSTFGHLSLIKAQVGEQVKRGEIVGYSGATGYVTGPHLHVSLYASGAVKMATKPSAACSGHTYTLPVAPVDAYLNALDYLPPYTINSSILNNQPTE